MVIKHLSFPLQIDKVSELFDSWVKFQETSGLMPYGKITISQALNTFASGDAGVT